MFKTQIIAAVISMFLGFSAFAEDHTPNFCSVKNENVCAHLGHFTGLTSSTEAQFMFHASTPNNEQMTDLKLDLWMPDMGHGSAPLKFEEMDVNLYKVTNAYFMMSGEWLVRASFKLGETAHQIQIPVTVK
jgi:hypothetical protein